MKTAKPTLSRRHFLLGGGAAAAASLATMSRKKTSGDTSTQASADTDKGYRATEHVRKYYRTARM